MFTPHPWATLCLPPRHPLHQRLLTPLIEVSEETLLRYPRNLS
ncbi:hypothetical protein HMPREF9134_01903 [Porphyromonas catoniae F0037]|uniref:Uncharacterized protein n=1 Tax=Porphyromonas catoniae F0037 TaxID=1127696 RepID=L1N9P6_9PORP|nr:hypothetical protein HMPREF9134_01903 [Porphyromonas catoniae F0037]